MKKRINIPRILYDAKDHPDVRSGYGVVGKHILPRFARRYGAENVVIYAPVFAREWQPAWEGMAVVSGLKPDYGEELIQEIYSRFDCNILLMVGDWFPLSIVPDLAGHDAVYWVQWASVDWLANVDEVVGKAKFMGKMVPWTTEAKERLASWGVKENVADPIPLGVEPSIWQPHPRGAFPQVMKSCGFQDDALNVLLLAAPQRRKSVIEQLVGLRTWMDVHKDVKVRLYLHTHLHGGEVDIEGALKDFKLNEITNTPDEYVLSQGGYSEEQMAAVFASADLCLNACQEGFGLSIIQANAVGIPCVVLAEGAGGEIMQYGAAVGLGHVDYYTAGRMTRVVPEPVGVAQAIDVCYKDGMHRRRNLDAARRTVEKYNWDRIAAQWFDLFEKVLEEQWRYSFYVPAPSRRLLRTAGQTVEVGP